MIKGRIPTEREFQENAARAQERRTRMQAAGSVQASQEARSLAGWIFAAIVVVLMGGSAYLELGPVAAVVMIVVLVLLVLFVRRMFR